MEPKAISERVPPLADFSLIGDASTVHLSRRPTGHGQSGRAGVALKNMKASRRGLATLLSCVALCASCAAPTLQFFTTPPPDHTLRTTFTDTILVMRYGDPDSVSTEGLHLAYDLLDRAEAAGESEAASALTGIINAIPDSMRIRERKPGSQEGDIIRRLQGKGLADQLIVMRADVLIVKEIAADTVARQASGEGGDDEPVEREERWLAMILKSDALFSDATEAARP
jgi:hypothetical protein